MPLGSGPRARAAEYTAGTTQSTDNAYADQAVRTQFSAQGNYTAQSTALSSIQSLFDVTGQTGVIGALNNLFQSFSAWGSATPTSTAAQQAVLTAAQTVAAELPIHREQPVADDQPGEPADQLHRGAGSMASLRTSRTITLKSSKVRPPTPELSPTFRRRWTLFPSLWIQPLHSPPTEPRRFC